MRVFLADTVHNSGRLSPNTVPYNVARIAAYCQQKHPDLSYMIFKDPFHLLDQLKAAPPDVLGLSNYFWNTHLNHRIAKYARTLRTDMVIVIGGPNLNRDSGAYHAYAAVHPYVDFVIVDEGETCFEALIASILDSEGDAVADLKSTDIPGTFAITGSGQIHISASRRRIKSLDDLPSPYLNGMLDPFLEQGMQPIVEFVRGCPYQCAFCEQGSAFFTKLARLTPERVYEEIEYIRGRDKTGQLIVADVNFGILKRDLEIAKYLKASFLEKQWPSDLYLYNAKLPTEETLACMETLYPMAALCMSFQSTEPQVLENIHRANIGYDKYSFITKWAKEKNIPVGTELIYGLPGETRETFLNGYETLLRFRADYMASYNLRLFPGMELNRPDVRRQYGMTTRFRPMDINLGEYDFEKPERLIEVEEIVLTTNSLSVEDFFHVRQIAFMVESLWNTGYLRPVLVLLARRGRTVMGIFDEIFASVSDDPRAAEFFSEYRNLAQAELVETANVFEDRVADDSYWYGLLHGRGVNMKLNLAFAGRLLFFQNEVDDFFHDTLSRIGADLIEQEAEAFADLLAHCRCARIDIDHPEAKQCSLIYDLPAWIEATYPDDIHKYRMPIREVFTYPLLDEARSSATRIKNRLARNGASLSAIAERMMMELPKNHRAMRRAIRVSAQSTNEAGDLSKLAGRMTWAGA